MSCINRVTCVLVPLGGSREWVLYLNHLREMKRDDPALLFDFFPNPFVTQPSLSSSSEPTEIPELLTIDIAILEALLKLGDPGLQVTLSSALAVIAYRYPWMAYPAAVLGTLGTMSWLETVAGHHIPARISLALNNLGAMASAPFLYYYHPMYAFVRFAGGDNARIMLGQRHRED